MLTKSDFTQLEKLVRRIVREEVANESEAIRDDITGEVKMAMMRTVTELRELKDRVKNLEIRLTKVHADLKKEIKLVVNFLDQDLMRLHKRVDKVEQQIEVASS